MAQPSQRCLLTINGGSSSIKFALFGVEPALVRLLNGKIGRIGLPTGRLSIVEKDRPKQEQEVAVPTQSAAVQLLLDWLEKRIGLDSLTAVGHRVVHGGPRYAHPTPITREVLDELRRISPYD